VSDIKEFLLARIAEDEEGANAAGGVAWDAYYLDGAKSHEEPKWILDSDPRLVSYEMTTEQNAKHAEAWSPARVLAECEAKRRIVDRSGGSVCGGDSPTHYPQDYAEGCDGCAAAQSADYETHWVLALLASVYADHPDFDEGWRL
jgi:hypothetical protein